MKNMFLIFAITCFCLLAVSVDGAQQQSETEMAKWQKSWDAFVDELQAHVSSGGGGTDFAAKVRGKVVVWEGTFRDVKESSNRWFAEMEFPARQVRWGDVDYRIVRPPIKISDAQLPRWQKLTPGSTIRIRITLETNNAFDAIFALGPKGDNYILLMPQDGELVEVLKSPKQ